MNRSLALFTNALGLVLNLIAMNTPFWVEVVTPTIILHGGLWPSGPQAAFMIATECFIVLAAVFGLIALLALAWYFIPWLSSPTRLIFTTTTGTAFPAAIFMIVAMAVYTNHILHVGLAPHWQVSFGWSFYLGWISAVLFLSTGFLNGAALCRRAGYESM
ncbi:protein NKG7 [Echinops telfairi]|uniref:Protein NKG7 n=1 Tax=Echinops telfairi TaxID=9371 RepID=A0ABM0IYE3_ECHTE|nr:protein NKG7 [Echinops telfairi]